MKFLVVLAVAVACAAADVANLEANAPVIRAEFENNYDGSYQYAYETGNGIYAQEQGYLQKNGENPSLAAKGAFGYNSPEGPIELTYIADENGFQPQGAHLPVSPPIPADIVRSLEYIRAHPPKE